MSKRISRLSMRKPSPPARLPDTVLVAGASGAILWTERS
jgi:hypothetical protein